MIQPRIRLGLFLLLSFSSLLIGAILISFSQKGNAVIVLNKLHNPVLDSFFTYFTHLGSGWIMVLIGVIFLFFQFRMALLVATIGLLQSIVSGVFKMLVFPEAPRPLTFLKDQYPLDIIEGATQLYYHSFPSGHTMTAFSLAAFLAFMTKNKSLQFALFIYALLTGISRVYLSHHFLIDVVFGAAFGVIVTFMGLYFNDKLSFLENSLLNRKRKL